MRYHYLLGKIGSHLAVLRIYSWLSIQGSCLADSGVLTGGWGLGPGWKLTRQVACQLYSLWSQNHLTKSILIVIIKIVHKTWFCYCLVYSNLFLKLYWECRSPKTSSIILFMFLRLVHLYIVPNCFRFK